MGSRVWLNSRNRVTVAQMCGESNALDEGAGRVLASVRAKAAESVLTGEYMSKLGIVTVPGESGTGRSVKDRLVVADDKAAVSIEYGHHTRPDEDGDRTFVPGKHPMTRGLAAVKSV